MDNHLEYEGAGQAHAVYSTVDLFTVLWQGFEPERERRPAVVVVDAGSLPSHATFINRRCISTDRMEWIPSFVRTIPSKGRVRSSLSALESRNL
jgi:hypothetical protein